MLAVLKAIVCGTIFGQSYMNALKMVNDIELVGIFSHGSERSKKCARQYGVPLYTDIENIPKNIDIAFVIIKSSVLGGIGTELSKHLLTRGIYVMQEHPVNYKEVEECYKIAKKNNINYRIGNLYNSLESVSKFIRSSYYLNKTDKLEYVDVLSSSQGLYTLMSILSESLPKFRNLNMVSNNQEKRYPFNAFIMTNGDIDVDFRVHNEVSDIDGNNHMHLLHKITFFYESGRLELEDTFGSVIWRSRMDIADSLIFEEGKKDINTDKLMNLKIFDEKEISFSLLISDVFSKAIEKEIEFFLEEIKSLKTNISNVQKEILVSKKWSLITEEIGFPKAITFKGNYLDHANNLRRIR
ncbi:hypothetical protein CKR_1400 [Clostridium kluyveri NBRC 12016]|uniref:Predicted NRPS reductase domain n=2 Tax=Clostridium kluyveri TaxID=1534 RepID=A5N8B7_CLOK5|nr:Predicted NRPS reductase domain [Clostridium kluyveri DSM 555]BAH06451.1 hypothetical protein CKR_1400 [Clostridium kluyveri NBRC 12016]